MKNKKGLILLFTTLMMLLLAACGSTEQTTNDSYESEKNQNGSSESEYYLRASSEFPVDDPRTEALNEFAEKVYEETDGRIEIEVYPAGQLGDYLEVYNEVARGTIELALMTVPSELDSRLELTFVPYLVTNYDEIEELFNRDSFIFNTLQEVHNSLGVRLLGFNASGFGGIGTVKEIDNILEIGEDKGLVIRTPVMEVFNQPMKDLGFRTMTLPYADLYTAMQTGTVEGWSGGEPSLNYSGFRDVIKYYYQTNDFMGASSLVINDELWNEFDEKDREIIQKIADENTLNSFKQAEEVDKHYRDLMSEEGIEIVEFTDEEIQTLAKHVRENTWPKLKERIGEDIMTELMEIIN